MDFIQFRIFLKFAQFTILGAKICFQKIREMKLRFENLEKKNYLDENLEKVLQTYLFLGSISHTNSNHHGR